MSEVRHLVEDDASSFLPPRADAEAQMRGRLPLITEHNGLEVSKYRSIEVVLLYDCFDGIYHIWQQVKQKLCLRYRSPTWDM